MQREQLVKTSYWPADTSEPLLDVTLGQLLRQVAAEVPDRRALVDGAKTEGTPRSWTYRELLGTAERIARVLLTHFQPGERVAVFAPNCPEWVLLQHGLHLAGLILVPMNPAYRQSEAEAIIEGSGAVGIFYVDNFRNNDIRATIAALQVQKPSLRTAVSLKDWDTFFAVVDEAVVLPDIKPDDILQLQYTSGTTGVPKGACLHHRGALNTSRFVAQRAGFPEGGIWLNAMPMFHIGGAAVTHMGCLSQRGTYVLQPGFDPAEVLELVERERANAMLVVPTMILALLEHPDFSRRRLDSIKTILTGAAVVPATLVHRTKKAFNCDLSILFGQTELNGVCSQTSIHDSVEDQSETLGKPLPQSEVAILDSETGEVQPLGVPGEICVRGYQTMRGYFGLPEATQKCIREDGWLRTGDMGTMDERGYLRIAGRLKDMIIRGGMNIYPREIEDVLFDHPAIGQVSVVAVPDEKWGEVVGAVIVPAADTAELPVLELHNYCRERLSAHKTPVLWYAVTQFPLTPSGKIQKFILQDQIARGELPALVWERPASSRDAG